MAAPVQGERSPASPPTLEPSSTQLATLLRLAEGFNGSCMQNSNASQRFCVTETRGEDLGFVCAHDANSPYGGCLVVLQGVALKAAQETAASDGPICPDCTEKASYATAIFLATCLGTEPNVAGALTCAILAQFVWLATYEECVAGNPDPSCHYLTVCVSLTQVCLGDVRVVVHPTASDGAAQWEPAAIQAPGLDVGPSGFLAGRH